MFSRHLLSGVQPRKSAHIRSLRNILFSVVLSTRRATFPIAVLRVDSNREAGTLTENQIPTIARSQAARQHFRLNVATRLPATVRPVIALCMFFDQKRQSQNKNAVGLQSVPTRDITHHTQKKKHHLKRKMRAKTFLYARFTYKSSTKHAFSLYNL